MKVPESGMPEEMYWESLFDVPLILDRMKVDRTVEHVAELGCGYGTFTLAVARRIQGIVFTYDIEPAMIERTLGRAEREGIHNINATRRDVLAAGFGLEPRCCDAVLLFNILHFPQPDDMIRKAVEVLRPGRRVLAIHWRSNLVTPRGPPLHLRTKPPEGGDHERKPTLVEFAAFHLFANVRARRLARSSADHGGTPRAA